MSRQSKLNLFDFTMIVVSLVIGMGIFRTPVNVAKAVPTPAVFFAAWLAGGLVALCGALTYAEIGSRYPVTGAYYRIFSYCYHPSIAFAVNCLILVSNATSLAGVALIGAEYITKVLFPSAAETQSIEVVIAVLSICIFYGVNLLGLKMSAKTQNVLTIIKIGMILLLILPIFFASGKGITSTHAITNPTLLEYLKAFGVGLVAVSFTYGGYQQTINFGAEVKNPNKFIPRGIFIGIFIIILLYLTINYAYYSVIGFDELKNSRNIAAIMLSHVFGDVAGKIVSILLFLSVLAYVNVLLMSNPRVMFAMSEDGVLPPVFKRKNNRTDALTISLTSFAAACVLIAFWAKEFDEILSFNIFMDCMGMILSAGSIFYLRKRNTQLDKTTEIYTMKLYPLYPLVFIAAYTFVAISIVVDKPWSAIAGLGVLSAFILIYFLTRRKIISVER